MNHSQSNHNHQPYQPNTAQHSSSSASPLSLPYCVNCMSTAKTRQTMKTILGKLKIFVQLRIYHNRSNHNYQRYQPNRAEVLPLPYLSAILRELHVNHKDQADREDHNHSNHNCQSYQITQMNFCLPPCSPCHAV